MPDSNRLFVVSDTTLDERGTEWRMYSASNGDFSCGPEGLALETRMGASSIESVGSEQRAFRVAADSSLVMHVRIADRGST